MRDEFTDPGISSDVEEVSSAQEDLLFSLPQELRRDLKAGVAS